MKKKIILAFIIILFSGIGTGLYYYYKPVESLKNKKADITVSSEKLFNDFFVNEENANTIYLNKIVNVGGSISDVGKNKDGSVTLTLSAGDAMGSVTCKMELNETAEADQLTKGTMVSINGKCTGYLMDVVMVNCSLTKNK